MSWITVKAANFNMPCLELEIEFILTTFLSHEIFFLETFIVSSFYSNKISTIFKRIINLKATCLTTITIKKHKQTIQTISSKSCPKQKTPFGKCKPNY